MLHNRLDDLVLAVTINEINLIGLKFPAHELSLHQSANEKVFAGVGAGLEHSRNVTGLCIFCSAIFWIYFLSGDIWNALTAWWCCPCKPRSESRDKSWKHTYVYPWIFMRYMSLIWPLWTSSQVSYHAIQQSVNMIISRDTCWFCATLTALKMVSGKISNDLTRYISLSWSCS